MAKLFKEPHHLDRLTMRHVLETLARGGHIAAAMEFMAPGSWACHVLKDEMDVESWESVEEPTGGCGERISWSSGRVPTDYEFSHPCWQTLYDYCPEAVQEWISTAFQEGDAD